MAIDFPNSPAPGTNHTVDGKTWTFTDGKWALNVGVGGVQGPTGATGPAGATGVTGPSGVPGEAGTGGLGGVDGATGPTGATGPEGAAGAVGAEGAPGMPGEPGVEGPAGPEGPTGATGPTGADGGGGVKYVYNYNNYATPTAGQIVFNSAYFNNVTEIKIHANSKNSTLNTSWISQWSIGGQLFISNSTGDVAMFTLASIPDITGSIYTIDVSNFNVWDSARFLELSFGYYEDPVTFASSSFNEDVSVTYFPVSTGPTGVTGPTGPTGPVSGTANQVIYKNGSNNPTGSSGLAYDGTDFSVGGKISSTVSAGDEGGELFLNKAATNTTINGGVTIDVWQNRLRFFEQGGTARGAYIDIAAAGAGVATNLLAPNAIYSGQPLKIYSNQLSLTQKIYAATGDTLDNIATYTTNPLATSYLLITVGVAYELNTSSDAMQIGFSINGVDQFSFSDSTNTVTYNEFPYYTFRSINSYTASSSISNIRTYVKGASGQVVCPRNTGGPLNFSLTIQEFAA